MLRAWLGRVQFYLFRRTPCLAGQGAMLTLSAECVLSADVPFSLGARLRGLRRQKAEENMYI